MKTISFVIPAYNSQAFLDKCIQSMITLKTMESVEIIVVNDGSTDQTPSIAQAYVDTYPDTVRLINQINKGHGGALNAGCAAAKGKYLKVIDADDWITTDNLAAYIEALGQCQSDVVLTPHYTIDISTGQIKNWRPFPEEWGKAYTLADIMSDWKGFDRSMTFHGITYKTEFYQSHREPLPEHVFYEDHVYATYPCCYATSVTPLDLYIYEYRIGDVSQSVSRANQLKRHSHTEAVLDNMTTQYAIVPQGAGKTYAAKKLEGLYMSYLTTTLLAAADRREGLRLARQAMTKCQARTPEVYAALEKKYKVFTAMHYLHMTDQTWDRLLHSGLYNKLRHNHSFEEE